MVVLDKFHSIYSINLDDSIPDQQLFFTSARKNIDYNCKNTFWNPLNLTTPEDDGERSIVDNLINNMRETRSLEFLSGKNNQIKPFNLSQSLIEIFGDEKNSIKECALDSIGKICGSSGCTVKSDVDYISIRSLFSNAIDSAYSIQKFIQKDLVNQVCIFLIGCAWKATWPYIKSKFSGRGYGDDTIRIIKHLHNEHGTTYCRSKYNDRELSHNDQISNKKLDIFSIYKTVVDFKINRGSFPIDENKPEFKKALLDHYTDHLEQGLINNAYDRELTDQHYVESPPYFYFTVGVAATACIAVNIINHLPAHYD